MIYYQFPDLNWLKSQAERRFSDQKAYDGTRLKHSGWPTVILNVASQSTYRDNIRGPLSLFTNISGESEVTIQGKSARVKEGMFFLTNRDQHYTLEINPRQPCETFNIHFGEHFIDEVSHSFLSTDVLLGNPGFVSHRHLVFHNRLQQRNASIDKIIRELKSGNYSSMQLEEKLYDLTLALLLEEKSLRESQQNLPVTKSSTREEIGKRLLLATDYIYSFFDQDLSLDDLAATSCLSKFHFLRLFKIAYAQTPYQFINNVRVARGKELLRRSSLEINQIASATGFNDASSFSRMFFQQTGMYPTAYRGMK